MDLDPSSARGETFGDVSGLIDGLIEGAQFGGDITHEWALVEGVLELVTHRDELLISDSGNREALIGSRGLDHRMRELTNQGINVVLRSFAYGLGRAG